MLTGELSSISIDFPLIAIGEGGKPTCGAAPEPWNVSPGLNGLVLGEAMKEKVRNWDFNASHGCSATCCRETWNGGVGRTFKLIQFQLRNRDTFHQPMLLQPGLEHFQASRREHFPLPAGKDGVLERTTTYKEPGAWIHLEAPWWEHTLGWV